jgi:hypothetical protein
MSKPTACIVFTLLLCAFIPSIAGAQDVDVAVVVNPKNPVASISFDELRKIFAGQKQSWPGNTPVRPIVRGSGTREREALLRLLGMSERDYKQYWTKHIFRGEAKSEPLTVNSNSLEKKAVNMFPGAIAFISAAEATTETKIVQVDGHLPGEPDYPAEFSEYRLKAGFLYRFAQFIDWPAESFKDANSPITFCTTVPDPLYGTLDKTVAGKVVHARPLQVRHSDNAADLTSCQILFIGERDEGRISSLLASVRNLPIVTVGETDRFVAHGGMIGFVWVDRDIRFDINLAAASPTGLKVSSPLISLAKSVTGVRKGN